MNLIEINKAMDVVLYCDQKADLEAITHEHSKLTPEIHGLLEAIGQMRKT